MPGTPVLLLQQEFASPTSPITTDPISPDPNCGLLVLVEGTSGGSSFQFNAVDSPSDPALGMRVDGQGRVFKLLNNDYGMIDAGQLSMTRYGSANIGIQAAYGVTSASPGTGTVRVSYANSAGRVRVQIIQIPDVSLYTPVRQFRFAGTASAAASHSSTLLRAPATGNLLIAFGAGGTAATTVAPYSGDWTELTDAVTGNLLTNVQYRTGTTDQNFGIEFGASLSGGIAIGCIEIRGAIPGEVPDPITALNFHRTAFTTSQRLPEGTDEFSFNDGDLILVSLGSSSGSGANSAISSFTSSFAVRSPGWQVAVDSGSIGSAFTRGVWYYAIADGSGTGFVTATWAASGALRGGAVRRMPAGSFDPDNPFRQVKAVTAASVAGSTELLGTLDDAPLAGSRIVAFGYASTGGGFAGSQLFAIRRNGWEWIGPTPVTEEGGNQTNYSAHNVEDQTFGGSFGTSDHTGGGVFIALEIQAPAAVELPGIRSTLLKEPNLPDSDTANASNVSVWVWHGATFSGAPDEVLTNQSITDGVLEFEAAVAVSDPVTYFARWIVGGQDRFFAVLNAAAIDLNA
jgi:hypothetical protein